MSQPNKPLEDFIEEVSKTYNLVHKKIKELKLDIDTITDGSMVCPICNQRLVFNLNSVDSYLYVKCTTTRCQDWREKLEIK